MTATKGGNMNIYASEPMHSKFSRAASQKTQRVRQSAAPGQRRIPVAAVTAALSDEEFSFLWPRAVSALTPARSIRGLMTLVRFTEAVCYREVHAQP